MANYTDAEISALRRAIASGVLTVEHEGTRTTYRNLQEMRQILRSMLDDVAGTTSTRTVAVHRRGS